MEFIVPRWMRDELEEARFKSACILFLFAFGPQVSRWVSGTSLLLLFTVSMLSTRTENSMSTVDKWFRGSIMATLSISAFGFAVWKTAADPEWTLLIVAYILVAGAYLRLYVPPRFVPSE